jgi:hypothetical protein
MSNPEAKEVPVGAAELVLALIPGVIAAVQPSRANKINAREYIAKI